jgi:hypothetical protein
MKTRGKQVAILAALSIVLAACAGPTVKTSFVAPVQPAESWRTDAGATAPIDSQWWARFRDPTLVTLVDRYLLKQFNDWPIAVLAMAL